MIQSPKASAFVENFGGQWLLANGMSSVAPDANLFPQFDDALRSAMRQETLLLFQDVASGRLSADQLLTANYTYVNDRLARHYGLSPVGTTDFEKVPTTGTPRGGVLAGGTFLTFTSHHDSTSPVGRGKAILSQLLCVDIAPPPQGVNTEIPPVAGATLRQRMEAHRTSPVCASCH